MRRYLSLQSIWASRSTSKQETLAHLQKVMPLDLNKVPLARIASKTRIQFSLQCTGKACHDFDRPKSSILPYSIQENASTTLF